MLRHSAVAVLEKASEPIGKFSHFSAASATKFYCWSRFSSQWRKHQHAEQTMRADLKEDIPFTEYVSAKNERAERVYVWGNVRTGALGIPSLLMPDKEWKNPVLRQKRPIKFNYPEFESMRVKHAAAGFGFSVYSGRKSGTGLQIISCGLNTDSQLGFHSENGRPIDYVVTPQPISLPSSTQSNLEVRDIACGRAHTVIATNHGVFSLGNNALGQCGRKIVPDEQYSGSMTINHYRNTDVVKVYCGHDHTFYLTKNGSLYSAGLGSDGQTGLGTFACTDEPALVQGDIKDVRIVDVSCKSDTVLAVSDEGEVFGWGNSEYGQLDSVTNETQVNLPLHMPITKRTGPVRSVAAAGSMCAACNKQGEVYVWGYGILGKGPLVQELVIPQMLPMTLFGHNEYSTDVKVEQLTCGISYFAAVTNSGNLYTWGRNTAGVLGLGHKKDQFFPFLVATGCEVKSVSAGADHMIALCKAFA